MLLGQHTKEVLREIGWERREWQLRAAGAGSNVRAPVR